MSKVYINSQNLNNGFIVQMNDAINIVQKALNYFDYFEIPFDFKKKNTLKNIESDLKSIKKELNNIKSWVVDSNGNYNTLINNLKNQANGLPDYQVKQRTNIV